MDEAQLFDRPTLWNLPASQCHLSTARLLSFDDFVQGISLVTTEESQLALQMYNDILPDAQAKEYQRVSSMLRNALRERRLAHDRFRTGRPDRYDWTRAAISYEPRKQIAQDASLSWHLPTMD